MQDPNIEGKRVAEAAVAVASHKHRYLLLKAILHLMIRENPEQTEQTINEAVINHNMVDERLTQCLDIKLIEEEQMEMPV